MTADTRPRVSQVQDWTKRPISFMPHDEGRRGSLQAWTGHGPKPKINDLLALRNGTGVSIYRVIGFAEQHIAADYDGFIARVVFVPGSTVIDDLKD